MRSFVVDGNFKANHLKQKNDNSDIWLTSGEGFMTNTARYKIHLQTAKETKTVSNSNTICFSQLMVYESRHRLATDIGHS